MDLQHLFTRENILFVPVFLIVISVLVAAHEYGHYLFARIFGMGVEEFAIGFGPRPIWTYAKKKYLVPLKETEVLALKRSSQEPSDVERQEERAHKTNFANAALALESTKPRLQSPGLTSEWSSMHRDVVTPELVETPNGIVLQETTNFTVRPFPVGGFVRIKGMMPEEDGRETQIPGGFYSKEPWKRFIVLLAGPVFSVLAGIVLIFIVLASFGALDNDKKPVVGTVFVDMPAYAAGLREGDLITSIDGVPMKGTFDVVNRIRFAGETPHSLTYMRNGKTFKTEIVPKIPDIENEVLNEKMEPTGKKAKQAMIGINWHQVFVHVSIGEAAIRSISAPAQAIAMMGSLVKTPAKLKESVGGPIAMLTETRKAVQQGLPDVLFFAAMLSISVGIFNLLPIVPLDGGQMAIAVAEMFRRRRLSMRSQNVAAAAGMLVVLMLVVFVFTIDFQKLGKSDQPKFNDVLKAQQDMAPNK